MIVEFVLLAIMLGCCAGGGLWLGLDIGQRRGYTKGVSDADAAHAAARARGIGLPDHAGKPAGQRIADAVFADPDLYGSVNDDPHGDDYIQRAPSDIAACLWTEHYAKLCANGLPHDMRTARDRGVPIVVLHLEGSPAVPPGLFPPGTRIAECPKDPAGGAAVIKRLHDEGAGVFPLLAAAAPEGT